MSRRPCLFTQADVTRALKGAIVAGMEIDHYEIDEQGRIIVFPKKQGTNETTHQESLAALI